MLRNIQILLAALFASVPLHAGSGAPVTPEAEAVDSKPDAFDDGTLLDPAFRISLGYDSKRYYRGFTPADDAWFWGQVELMAFPFDFYYKQGVTTDIYEEQIIGVGAFIPLPANFVFRAGWEFNNYGKGDLFIDDNHLGLAGLFHNSRFGRAGLRWTVDGRFDGHLYELGFFSNPFPVTDRFGVALGSALRWNDKFYGVSGRGWSNLEFLLSFPIQTTGRSRLIPFVRYSEAFGAVEAFEESEFTGGVTWEITF